MRSERKFPAASLPLVLLCAVAALLVFFHPAAAKEDKAKKSGIEGRISMKATGQPVEKAYVYAYVGKIETRAAQLGIIGITDWVSHGSTEDGSYKLDLPPGDYYVAARKRVNGLNYGPLYKGDWYDHSPARHALRVKKGKYTKVDFALIKLEEPMFFQGLTASQRVTETGVRGRLLDENGAHVPGTFVMGYKNSDMQRVPASQYLPPVGR